MKQFLRVLIFFLLGMTNFLLATPELSFNFFVKSGNAEYFKQFQRKKGLDVLIGYDDAKHVKSKNPIVILPSLFSPDLEKELSATVTYNNVKVNFYTFLDHEPLVSKLKNHSNLKTFFETIKNNPKNEINIARAFSLRTARKLVLNPDIHLVVINSPRDFTEIYDSTYIIGVSSRSPVFIALQYSGKSVNVHKEHLSLKEKILKNEKEDTRYLPALSSIGAKESNYTDHVFEQISGGLALKASGADVAILSKMSSRLNHGGEKISYSYFSRRMSKGKIFKVHLLGAQIKHLSKLIHINAMPEGEFFTYGIHNGKINQRLITDNETYKVALDEDALVQLFNIENLGALDEIFSVRAPFIEGIYGKITNLYFVSGPKTIKLRKKNHLTIADTWDNAVNTFIASDTKEEQIKLFLHITPEQFKQTVTFNIEALDFGFSQNFGNDTYTNYQNEKAFSISRADVPLFAQLFISNSMKLTYDAGPLETQLTNEIKYLQSNVSEKPEKDKLAFGLNFRVPFERSVFKENSSFVLSPVQKNTYETKLANYIFPNNTKLSKPNKKLENFLGLKFDIKKAMLDFELGALASNDLNQKGFENITSFGPGLYFNSKWPIYGPLELSSKIKSYYFFSMPGNTLKNNMAYGLEGTVWLRVAAFHNFSVSLMSDFMVASLQREPFKFASSSIFGITLSYGNLFKLVG